MQNKNLKIIYIEDLTIYIFKNNIVQIYKYIKFGLPKIYLDN